MLLAGLDGCARLLKGVMNGSPNRGICVNERLFCQLAQHNHRFSWPSPAEKRSFLPQGSVGVAVTKDRFSTPSHTPYRACRKRSFGFRGLGPVTRGGPQRPTNGQPGPSCPARPGKQCIKREENGTERKTGRSSFHKKRLSIRAASPFSSPATRPRQLSARRPSLQECYHQRGANRAQVTPPPPRSARGCPP